MKNYLRLFGEPRTLGDSKTSVTVKEYDSSNQITRATGDTVPTDGDAGYAVGCIFIDTDGGIGTTIYGNDGSITSCDFNVSLGGTGDITSVVAGAGMTGGATSGAATVNVINTDGKITVGADTIDITALTLEEGDLIAASTDGLNVKRTARATYDFSVLGGAVSAIGLGVTLPDNAIITRSWIDITTGMTSSGGSATFALSVEGANDIISAVDADTLSGLNEGIQDGTAAAMVKTTSAQELTMTIAEEALEAGVFVLYCEYVVSA